MPSGHNREGAELGFKPRFTWPHSLSARRWIRKGFPALPVSTSPSDSFLSTKEMVRVKQQILSREGFPLLGGVKRDFQRRTEGWSLPFTLLQALPSVAWAHSHHMIYKHEMRTSCFFSAFAFWLPSLFWHFLMLHEVPEEKTGVHRRGLCPAQIQHPLIPVFPHGCLKSDSVDNTLHCQKKKRPSVHTCSRLIWNS